MERERKHFRRERCWSFGHLVHLRECKGDETLLFEGGEGGTGVVVEGLRGTPSMYAEVRTMEILSAF